MSVPPQRRVEHELQQLLVHVEQHESHDMEKRRRIQQLLDDVRSSDPKRVQRAKRIAKQDYRIPSEA
ncbi:hypothetical protein MUP07_07570 [Candidatus Bathyarchaeota archaeon]|nr:hypothetical protein [Candidatus Bathyarchaeota archaeon]